jgi:choline dehydrogenase-like flavoprotein
MQDADCDYIVVGSGAGGGAVAARLAESGQRVILLEAGGDPRCLVGGDPVDPEGNRLPDDYDVPAFHPFASENDAISWHFFVRHYADDRQKKRDPSYRETWDGHAVEGVLYPRASCLGGCTAHNAMIFVAPDDADWDAVAAMTQDQSWRAANMAKYFARVENCHHRWLWRCLAKLGIDPTGHGWNGWLHTEKVLPREALADRNLLEAIAESAGAALGEMRHVRNRLEVLLGSFGDPNDRRITAAAAEGLFYTPLATHQHRRNGSRERVLDVAERLPHRLDLRVNALATQIIFDAQHRAIGVEYLQGARLYRAARSPAAGDSERRVVRAAKEVILSGGAFNTPQLLMLSGIGPRAVLQQHGIPVRVDLAGVGRNLQDRYEVGVVNRMNFDAWASLGGANFARGDPLYRAWALGKGGMYASNGSGLTIATRSDAAKILPDIFCMALLAPFEGYFPGYSRAIAEGHNYLTWTILKAHTNNRAGWVTLRTADPRDPPEIDFRYFEEGDDVSGEDLRAVVEGIRFVRKMTAKLKRGGLIAVEELPGENLLSDAQLAEFVRDRAWGHHACGTCAIGPFTENGVVDSDFRVHGTNGLRVVDASVFPRIPGFFIASAVYMIAEKAADVILAD